MMVVPQLEMQPFCPGAAVPGAPVEELLGVQYSAVTPHWPQMSQHSFKGQVFRRLNPPAGFSGCGVPGTCGPHIALEIGAGKGGLPVLRQM